MRLVQHARGAAGAIACWVLAVLHAVVAFDIVFRQRIGPVISIIDESAGHGVHAGDVFALPVLLSGIACFVAAVGFTAAELNRPRPLPWRQPLP